MSKYKPKKLSKNQASNVPVIFKGQNLGFKIQKLFSTDMFKICCTSGSHLYPVNRFFFLFVYFSPSRLLFFVSTKASRLAWELLQHIPCFPSFALFCDSNFCRSSCFSSFAVAVFLLLKNPGIQQGGEDQAWDLLRRIGL